MTSTAQTTQAPFEIPVLPGQLTVIAGPNGVGKSAMLDVITTYLGPSAERLAGYRQIIFPNDDMEYLGQSLESFVAMLGTNHHAVTRFRHPWGDQHFKSVIKRLVNSESQVAADVISEQRNGMSFQDADDLHPGVLKRLNSVFAAARLPVKLSVQMGALKADRGAGLYSIDRLSDGERAALFIVGVIMVQTTNGYVVIDEPERHLNPSISAPLIAAAMRLRPDLGYVLATHDASLIETLKPERIVHVRDSRLIQAEPEVREYDLHLLTAEDGLPDDLKLALLGSRKALLLTEGEPDSDDKAVYSQVYAGWNPVPRGGWDAVQHDVRTLNNHSGYHWLNTAGIIDGDARSIQEVETLKQANVFALPFPTIENAFFFQPVISELAELLHKLKGGQTGSERVAALEAVVATAVEKDKQEVVARRLVWRANRRLAEQKTSYKQVLDGQESIAGVELQPIRTEILASIDQLLLAGDVYAVLKNIPLKSTKIPDTLVRALGFSSFKEYKQIALAQVEQGSIAGSRILSCWTSEFPHLPQIT